MHIIFNENDKYDINSSKIRERANPKWFLCILQFNEFVSISMYKWRYVCQFVQFYDDAW